MRSDSEVPTKLKSDGRGTNKVMRINTSAGRWGDFRSSSDSHMGVPLGATKVVHPRTETPGSCHIKSKSVIIRQRQRNVSTGQERSRSTGTSGARTPTFVSQARRPLPADVLETPETLPWFAATICQVFRTRHL